MVSCSSYTPADSTLFLCFLATWVLIHQLSFPRSNLCSFLVWTRLMLLLPPCYCLFFREFLGLSITDFWHITLLQSITFLFICCFCPTACILLLAIVQSLRYVRLSVIPWIATHQASLSCTLSLFKLKSVNSVMLSKHRILCHPFLLGPAIFPNIRVLSSEAALHITWSKYWNFSFSYRSFQWISI